MFQKTKTRRPYSVNLKGQLSGIKITKFEFKITVHYGLWRKKHSCDSLKITLALIDCANQSSLCKKGWIAILQRVEAMTHIEAMISHKAILFRLFLLAVPNTITTEEIDRFEE